MRVALTGGATGIGAAVAAQLTTQGHHVTAYDLIEPKGNVDQWIKTDLSNAASIESAINKSPGPFDALINNAGLPPREGRTELVLNVNFIGFRHFTQALLPCLAKDAAIVNTASKAGAMWRDNIDQVKGLMALKSAKELAEFIAEHNIDYVRAYNLSKEAVIAYTMAETENMHAHGLRMNCVSPAAVSTDILDDFVNAFGERVAANIKRVGRPGTAEEIADVILFLAQPQSRWLKGTDIVIDGGMGAMAVSDQLGLS